MNKNTLIIILKNPRRAFQMLADNGLLTWIPDSVFLKIAYYLKLKKRLNIEEPKTFNEKLQWLKLHNRKPEYTRMVDKYEAKKYVTEIVGDLQIIPTIGVWESFDQINFDELPEQFVLKCTHDSGGLVICRNKMEFDKEAARKKIQKCMKKNYYWIGREWPYKNVTPRIISEKYMEDESGSLIDYKFYCFNGKPEFLYISEGLENHPTARISFVTMDWKFAPFRRTDYIGFEQIPDKPKHFDRMAYIAGELSKGHPFLRVDLYEIGDDIYFSELTFSPNSGMMPFNPENYDRILGDMLTLPEQ